jgi:carbamate kinase
MNKQRVVIALGGNALQKNGEVSAEAQKSVANQVGETIARLSRKYEIIIAHGNGPQVGNILLHEETAATPAAPAMPLETAVAMSQGQIGYWLMQAITNAFAREKRRRDVATIVTQVVVDPKDPAFRHPTKPIGQFYTAAEAVKLAKSKRWEMREDSGRGYRRVVPSPQPIDIIEKKQITTLVEAGAIVIAVGGGGIPVVRSKVLKLLRGVDAVIDKDAAAEKLAELVKADIFVSVTAVPNAYINFGKKDQIALGLITKNEANHYIKAGEFGTGSMLPKIEAVTRFANTRRIGIITDPANLENALRQKTGTIVKG